MLPVRVGHPVLYRPLAPLRVRHAPQARLCRVPGQDCRVVCLNPRVGVPAVSLKHRQLHTAVFMRLRTVRGGGQHVRRARAQAKAKVLQNTSLTRWTAANTTPSSPVGTATTSYSSSGSLASAAAAAGGGVKRAGRAPDDSTAPTPPRTATRGHGGPAGTCSCGCACLIVDTGRHSAQRRDICAPLRDDVAHASDLRAHLACRITRVSLLWRGAWGDTACGEECP